MWKIALGIALLSPVAFVVIMIIIQAPYHIFDVSFCVQGVTVIGMILSVIGILRTSSKRASIVTLLLNIASCALIAYLVAAIRNLA